MATVGVKELRAISIQE